MGKGRNPKVIRLKARILLRNYPSEVETFESAKKLVKEKFPSMTKKMRNTLAGYLVRRSKLEKFETIVKIEKETLKLRKGKERKFKDEERDFLV